jgi:hypothetical protein
MPQKNNSKKNKAKDSANHAQQPVTKTSVEKALICCWEQDYDVPETLATLHHYNLDSPALKALAEWLLLTEKIAEFALQPDVTQTAEKLAAIKEQTNATTDEAWQAWLKEQQVEESTITQRIAFQNQLTQLKEAVVTEAALKEAFLQQKTQRDTLIFQVGKFPCVETAQVAWQQLTQDHRDFTHLILTQTTDVQQQGVAGLIGPVVCSQINPEVLRRIIRLEPQEYSDPFTVNGTEFMIVRLLNKQLLTPSPTLTQQLKDQVFQQWLAQQLRLAKPHWRFFSGQAWQEAVSGASTETQSTIEKDPSVDVETQQGLLQSLGFLFRKKGGSA